MKKILLLKIIFKQNFYWILATALGLFIILCFCSSTIPYVLKLPSKSWESTLDWEYSSYDKYASVVFGTYFSKGTLNFITNNFITLGYFSIINSIFIIKYHFKLKNVYQIKRFNNIINYNNINYIPLIVSIVLFIITIFSLILFDVFFINVIIFQKIDYLKWYYLEIRINKIWQQEFKNLLNNIFHYIFVLGICYFVIDISKYKLSKFISLKLILIILSIILIIPFILNIINESLISAKGNNLNKILDLLRFIINPFDEWYLFIIGSSKEYVKSFSFDNIDLICQILRIVYSLIGISYIIYHFKANRGKYE